MTTIRRIVVGEAQVVRELYRHAVQELADRYPEDRIAISERGLDNFETLFRLGAVHEDVFTLVAVADGELVGFVNAQVTRSPGLPGLAGEVSELWTRKQSSDDRTALVAEAARLLRERGASPVFHHEDRDHPVGEPWEELGFRPDVTRYSLYE